MAKLVRSAVSTYMPQLKTPLSALYRKLNTQIPTKEIQIPVSYGHISGKLWGSGDKQPILALHGWQDNAGTWDPLIPMIIKDRPILALDFPGHGLSSWISGTTYNEWEWPRLILYLKDYFKWDKVSFLSHSMGAIAAMRFACLFPDDVDFYIAIDSFILEGHDLNTLVDKIYPKLMQKGLMSQNWLDKEPPAYTLEEIPKTWNIATNGSIAVESVQHLLKRGVKQSKIDPNKYYFSRDPRVKYALLIPEDKKMVEALVRRLKCPMLHIKAIDSPFSSSKFSLEMRDILQKQNDKYEFHFVPGTHHVHLNNPEVVAPIIEKFIQNYKLNM
ncbi:probable serine hydrolase [Helicoverpa zea]|uniref:probable serine hydrolase n=1 Tax=Helicoverpa zea TaxID=7113 RepID=UPI001F5767F2|nr:probable serine hydrolase [Helicoverpa zea]